MIQACTSVDTTIFGLSPPNTRLQLAGGTQEASLHALHTLRDVLQQGPFPFRASLCLFYSVTNNVPYKVEPSSGKAGDVLVVKGNTLSIFFRTLQANENR